MFSNQSRPQTRPRWLAGAGRGEAGPGQLQGERVGGHRAEAPAQPERLQVCIAVSVPARRTLGLPLGEVCLTGDVLGTRDDAPRDMEEPGQAALAMRVARPPWLE